MIHQPIEVKESLIDDILVQGAFVFDDHGAVVIVQAERIDTPAVYLARDIFGCNEPRKPGTGIVDPGIWTRQ